MKKLSAIIIAMALLLGMSQCKKENTNSNTNAEGKKVYITMKANSGDRHIVYPGTGAVVYEDDDVIYVGDGSQYIGYLTYGNGTFSGYIDAPTPGSYLYFYFLGGKGPDPSTLTDESIESFTVDISDQSEKLPILSCGKSTTAYTDGTATYSCMLRNKCALVKFTTPTATSDVVKVGGMKNVATVNFGGTPGITPSGATGKVTLYSESSESSTYRWAVLLPQDEVTDLIRIGESLYYEVSVPEMEDNGYVTSGVTIGAQLHPFSVSATEVVLFSPGNLQYQASTGTWRFAEHHWDYVGGTNQEYGTVYENEVKCDNSQISQSYSGWIDLFGWGTSGWSSSGATYYHPWDYNNSDGSLYGPSGITNLTGNYANADWGVYNAIYNPKTGNTDAEGTWRALSADEWKYVTKTRTTTSTRKFALAVVNGVNGAILLPDDWDTNYYTLSYATVFGCSANIIQESDWNTLEQKYGAVFLPAAGMRDLKSFNNNDGYYWSSTAPRVDNASYIYVNVGEVGGINNPKINYRSYGYSVRLVRDIN